MRDAFDGDLLLAHRFEQCGLSLGCGAVDLVCEDDLGHYRAGAVFELTDLLVVHRCAGDVAGEKIRCELDAFEVAAGGDGDRACKHGLADAGDVFNEDVSSAEEGDDGEPDCRVFADDDASDVLDDAVDGIRVSLVNSGFCDSG